MIGNFKPNVDKNLSTESICITTNEHTAMYQYLRTKSSFITTFTVEDKTYFHVFKIQKTIKWIQKHLYMSK